MFSVPLEWKGEVVWLVLGSLLLPSWAVLFMYNCEVRSAGSLGLVAKNRLQFTNEPPLVRALQLV